MRYSFILIVLLLTGCIHSTYTRYKPLYEKEYFEASPNYSQLIYWAAHPAKKDPSDSIPKPLINQFQANNKVDVFFIHPTSYLDTNKPSGWNASLKDIKLNISTDFSSILYQASVFNEAGNVYAPRYRQAHIESYTPLNSADTLKALEAFEIAYQDVKTAFEYYLSHYNQGKPIIIASHSQGSTHSQRLLKEFFDAKPLSKQLVAAYVVGMAINPDQFQQLKACERPNETGCICAWRTYLEDHIPPFVLKEKFTSIVTNPLSWDKQKTRVDRNENKGSVLMRFNKLVPNVADAFNHDGLLWTGHPHFMGSFLYQTDNYHIADYNFYYSSIRENAKLRAKSFLNNTTSSSH